MQELRRLITKYSTTLKRGGSEPDFFYLVRLIENLKSQNPKIGFAKEPKDEAVRFGQMPYLNFPATTIHSITEKHDNGEDALILVYFLGLLGGNGPMPLSTTEYVYGRAKHHYDNSLRRFLDIINHRYIELFYRAFAQNELSVNFDRDKSQISNSIKMLTGALNFDNTSLKPHTIKSFARFLSYQDRTVDGLKELLQDYFEQKVVIKDFVKKWQVIPKDLRMHLGTKNTTLGVDSQLGSHYLSNTKNIEIILGPLTFEDSLSFMPKKKMFNELYEITKMYLDKTICYDLILQIKADTVPKISLNKQFALGQSCHFVTNANQQQILTVKLCVDSIIKAQTLRTSL